MDVRYAICGLAAIPVAYSEFELRTPINSNSLFTATAAAEKARRLSESSISMCSCALYLIKMIPYFIIVQWASKNLLVSGKTKDRKKAEERKNHFYLFTALVSTGN